MLAYGEGGGFSALAEIVKQQAGILVSDDAATDLVNVREKRWPPGCHNYATRDWPCPDNPRHHRPTMRGSSEPEDAGSISTAIAAALNDDGLAAAHGSARWWRRRPQGLGDDSGPRLAAGRSGAE